MILNLWCILIVVIDVLDIVLTVQLVFIHEFHADLLNLWLLLSEDCFHPCTLWYNEYFIIIGKFLFVQATWLLQAVLRKGSGTDIKVALDDVLDALWQAFPSATEVALQQLDELAGCNMAYVLVCQVGNAHDRTLLDGILHVLVIDTEGTDLEATFC